jgi:hypothetical protein
MKNHISNFSRFINENVEDTPRKDRNRDVMIYLIPRKYRIKVELNSEFSGDRQAKSEGMLTQRLSRITSDKLKFSKHQGVNIVGDTAYFKLETSLTEEFFRQAIEIIFAEAIGGEIDIQEVSDDDFNSTEYYW